MTDQTNHAEELRELRTLTRHRGSHAERIALVQAAATAELVEAVRDLCGLVALAVAPTYPDEPIVDESDAEGARDADTVGAWAEHLTPGMRVEVVAGGAFTVTAAGTSEGAAWLEVFDDEAGSTMRVWVDDLARDERKVANVTGAPVDEDALQGDEPQGVLEVDLVTTAPRVDADDDLGDEPETSDDDEGGADDDFDVTV